MLYIQIVQRAFDLVKAFGSYVRVYLGGFGIFVAEQALYGKVPHVCRGQMSLNF